MKRLNSILHRRLVTIVAVSISCGAVSSTFAQKDNGFGAFDSIFAQNESSAKYDLLTPDFTFTAAKYLKRNVFEYPKPDFSDIEKWYEVVRYEYGDIEGGENHLYFWLKPKSEARPDFSTYYYDRDGVMIGSGHWGTICDEGNCYSNAPVGTVQKYRADTPPGKMKTVAVVKIERLN